MKPREKAAQALGRVRLNTGGKLFDPVYERPRYCAGGALAHAAGAPDAALALIDEHTDDARDVAEALIRDVPGLAESYALDVERLHAGILAFDDGGHEAERVAAFLDAAYGVPA